MLRRTAAILAGIVIVGVAGVAPPATATDYTITAKAATANVVVKKKLVITGTVLPAKGKVVTSRKAVVQQWRKGKWRYVTQGQIWADGSFRVKPRFKTKGVKTLRILKRATSESPAVATAAFQIRVVKKGTRLVYPGPTVTSPTVAPPPPVVAPPPPAPLTPTWRALTPSNEVETGASGGCGHYGYSNGEYTNGVFTPNVTQAVLAGCAGLGDWETIDWALNRRCEAVTAHIGIDDDSPAASNLRVEVLLDGVSAYTRDFVLGQSESLNLPVTNALRVRLKVTTLADPTAYTYLNFGDLKALCLP